MTTVLHISASGNRDGSVSRAATAQILQTLSATKVIDRDLAKTPLPQVDETWIKTRLVPESNRSKEEAAVLGLSYRLIEEIKAADIIVIGTPIYNFGLPAALKAWIDLIALPKVTFAYTENGPVGLLEGKKAIVAVASGGLPVGAPLDFATPHIEQVLRFIGIDDIAVHAAKNLIAQEAA